MSYDRNNPKMSDLLKRLEDYSLKEYGCEAYPLSQKEAKLLVSEVNDLLYKIANAINSFEKLTKTYEELEKRKKNSFK